MRRDQGALADPPGRRQRRRILGTLCLTEAVSWGVLAYAFPVLLPSIERDLDASRGAASGAYSIALAVAAVAAVPTGKRLDRSGPRVLMTGGATLASAGVLAWSLTQELWQLYLAFAVIGLGKALVLYEPAFATVATWYEGRAERPLALLLGIGAMGSVIFPPLTAELVAHFDWREVLLFYSALLLVATAVPHALVLRPAPTLGAAARTVGRQQQPLLRQPGLLAFLAVLTIAAFVWTTVLVHLVPYLLDRGLSVGDAAVGAAVLGATQVAGRLLFLAPTAARPLTAMPTILALQACSLLALALVSPTSLLFGLLALFGLAKGAITLVRAAGLVEAYGTTRYGAMSGAVGASLALTQAVGPFAAGVAYDATGSYDAVLVGLATLLWLATLASFTARRTLQAPIRVTGS